MAAPTHPDRAGLSAGDDQLDPLFSAADLAGVDTATLVIASMVFGFIVR